MFSYNYIICEGVGIEVSFYISCYTLLYCYNFFYLRIHYFIIKNQKFKPLILSYKYQFYIFTCQSGSKMVLANTKKKRKRKEIKLDNQNMLQMSKLVTNHKERREPQCSGMSSPIPLPGKKSPGLNHGLSKKKIKNNCSSSY